MNLLSTKDVAIPYMYFFIVHHIGLDTLFSQISTVVVIRAQHSPALGSYPGQWRARQGTAVTSMYQRNTKEQVP